MYFDENLFFVKTESTMSSEINNESTSNDSNIESIDSSFDDKYILRDAGYASYCVDLDELESNCISLITTVSSESEPSISNSAIDSPQTSHINHDDSSSTESEEYSPPSSPIYSLRF